MEAPRRKITAKVEPSAVHSPAQSRPVSRAASPIVNPPLPPPDDSLSPSASPAPRPKAKITSTTTPGTLKTPKSTGSLAVSGRKTPASSVVGRTPRDRPNSVIGTPSRSPFGQINTPPVPPSRRAPSPQLRAGPRLLSPEPPTPRVTPGSRVGRPAKPPSPPLGKQTPPSRRAPSPAAPAGRRNASPTRKPPLTLPRRTTSPTRSSIFGSQRSPTHRRVASASASSSVVSGGGDQPSPPPGDVAKTRLKLPSSLSSITLTRPSTFSSIPASPSRPAYPALASPATLNTNNRRDSSPEPTDLSAPPSAPLSAAPQGLLSTQDSNRTVSSAPVTPTHVQTRPDQSPANTGFPRPRNSSVTIVPDPDEDSERPQVGGVVTESSPPVVRIKAKVTHVIPSAKPTAQVRPQQLAAPPRQRSGSISATSSLSALSGAATSTLSRTSSVRVTSASTILSPPLRPVPAVGIFAPGSRVSIPPAMRSPSASTLSSSSSTSQASTSSRTNSSTQSTSVGRTPMDAAARAKMTSGPSKLGNAAPLHPPDEDGVERDDSGIDMFEADDGEHELREEARSNRKIADLEISNKSLLAINATLESTKARQAKEIRDLRRRLRESRLILPPPAFNALERSDPVNTSFEDGDDDEDSDDNDVTQLQADETFARVQTLLDQLLTSAKDALEAKPPVPDPETLGPIKKPIRVLNEHEAVQYVTDQTDESAESRATDSVAGDLPESIDEDSPSAMMGKAEVPTPKFQPASFGMGLFNRWSQR